MFYIDLVFCFCFTVITYATYNLYCKLNKQIKIRSFCINITILNHHHRHHIEDHYLLLVMLSITNNKFIKYSFKHFVSIETKYNNFNHNALIIKFTSLKSLLVSLTCYTLEHQVSKV